LADDINKRDDNRVPTLAGVTDDANADIKRLLVDGNGRLKVTATITGGQITSLNGLTGATQTFTDDTNVTIVSGGTAHVITWSGQLAVSRGGTGLSTIGGTNTVLFTTSADTISSIATANNGVLITSGAGVPSISSTIPNATQDNITRLGTVTSGTWNGTDIAVADGGSGRSTATAFAVLCGGTTSTAAHQSIAALGSSGEVLTSNGAGALPTFQAAAGANTALSNLASVAINTTLVSDTDNTDALGTSSIGWSDLFLGDGAVINFNNGDVTLTHSSNQLAIAGG